MTNYLTIAITTMANSIIVEVNYFFSVTLNIKKNADHEYDQHLNY